LFLGASQDALHAITPRDADTRSRLNMAGFARERR
jgi:hypothetical protein